MGIFKKQTRKSVPRKYKALHHNTSILCFEYSLVFAHMNKLCILRILERDRRNMC